MSKINIEKSYALMIGVGQRPTDSPAFAITEKDALLMKQRLSNDCGFEDSKLKVLTKPETKKATILEQLDVLIANTQNGADLVVVFFSGHGAKLNNDYYLVALDSDTNQNLIKTSEFVERLDKINADKLLVLLDCCHAGGVAEYEYTAMFDDASFFKNERNRAVIASSRSGEYSFLGNEYSLFTAAVANALHGDCLFAANSDQKIYLLDFAAYIYATVSNANPNQHPQLKILNNGRISNFIIADYTDGTPYDNDMPITELYEFSNGKMLNLKNTSREDIEKTKKNFENMIKNSVENSTITAGRDIHIGDNNIVYNTVNNYINQIISIKDIDDLIKEKVLEALAIFQVYKKEYEETKSKNQTSNINIKNMSTIKQLIENDSLGEAIDQLLALAPKHLENSVILLKSRYNSLKRAINEGTLNAEYIRIETNQIKNATLSYCDEIGNKQSEPVVEKSTKQYEEILNNAKGNYFEALASLYSIFGENNIEFNSLYGQAQNTPDNFNEVRFKNQLVLFVVKYKKQIIS